MRLALKNGPLGTSIRLSADYNAQQHVIYWLSNGIGMVTISTSMVVHRSKATAPHVWCAALHTIKCQPLKHLDPTDKLTIADWLIKFRAAAGASCAIAFSTPVPRSEFRIHFKLIGAGFWDELDGMSEVEFFDDLYGKYLEKYAFINGVMLSGTRSPPSLVASETSPACLGGAQPAMARPCMTGLSLMGAHGCTDDAATQELLITPQRAPLSCALAPLRTRTKTRTTIEVAVASSHGTESGTGSARILLARKGNWCQPRHSRKEQLANPRFLTPAKGLKLILLVGSADVRSFTYFFLVGIRTPGRPPTSRPPRLGTPPLGL